MDSKGSIWVALDTDKPKALEIAKIVAPHPAIYGFKANRLIDQEVFRKDGEPALFDVLGDLGKHNWADVKIIDVPRTVVGRLMPYIESGKVQYVTIMAKGEVDMMMDAVKAVGDKASIIAVTELTSLTEEQIHLGSGHPSKASVINLARCVVLAGARHLVCSAKELEALAKRRELSNLIKFVPGITPAWKSNAPPDQNRVGTPAFVYSIVKDISKVKLVIGSAIIEAKDPWDAVQKTAEEIEAVEQ